MASSKQKKIGSRHRLDGKITAVTKGVSIYKTHASPYYQARIYDRRTQKYVVRSTKETSKIEARKAAEELAESFLAKQPVTPIDFTFETYAQRYLSYSQKLVAAGLRNSNYVRTTQWCLSQSEWGLLAWFGHKDVRKIQTRDWHLYLEHVETYRPDLRASTLNSLQATLRNVLKAAQRDGVIDEIPNTPRAPQSDNPRAFFKFHPEDGSEWQKLKRGAKKLAAANVTVRGALITEELYDLMLFCVHSFVRPTTTELFALKHEDVIVRDDPKRLQLTIRNGKTGFRTVDTMGAAVAPYKRLRQRYPNSEAGDYIFLPQHQNRQTASRIIARQFNYLLNQEQLKFDPTSGSSRSLYCLRHTAICMRIALSGGIDLHILAKNAGTSVNQIERFYARNLPMSNAMVKELHKYSKPTRG